MAALYKDPDAIKVFVTEVYTKNDFLDQVTSHLERPPAEADSGPAAKHGP